MYPRSRILPRQFPYIRSESSDPPMDRPICNNRDFPIWNYIPGFPVVVSAPSSPLRYPYLDPDADGGSDRPQILTIRIRDDHVRLVNHYRVDL